MQVPARPRQRILAAFIVTLAAIAALGVSTVLAVCSPTAYTVTASAPPPTANWTSTAGLWQPAGGFPGCAPGDSAADTNVSPTTIIVNSSIPNPIIGLNLACNGCVIDIQPGGALTLAGSGSVGNGAQIKISGGTLTVASGTLTLQSGAALNISSGTLDVQGGTIDGSGTITESSSGTIQKSTGSAATISATLNTGGSGGIVVVGGTLSVSGGGTGDAPVTLNGGTLDFPAGSYSLTANGTVSGAGTLQVSGGTLSIGGVTSPAAFTLTAGTLTGSGFLSITNTFHWSGGTISGTGGTELAGGGSGTIDGAASSMTLDGRTFNDYGSITYSAATTNLLVIGNSGVLNVFGTFNITGDGSIMPSGSATINVEPNGVFWKSGGSLFSTIYPQLNNAANVTVSSGTLELAGGGIHDGSFFADAAGTLLFSSSNTFNSGSQVSGPGRVDFGSGSQQLGGTYDVSGETTISGAFVSVTAPASTYDFVSTFGTLSLGAGFSVTHNMTWSGGGISGAGTFTYDGLSGGQMTIDGATGSPSLNGATMVNNGTIVYNSPSNPLYIANAAIFNNNGLFDIQTDQPILATLLIIIGDFTGRPKPDGLLVTGSTFNNLSSGTLQKSAGTGTTQFGPSLINDGQINLESGTLETLNAFTQNSGTTSLVGGSLTADAGFTVNGGILNGSGTITGNYTQNGGSMALTIAGPSTFDQINVTGNATLGGNFTATLIGGYQPANGATFPVLTYAGRTGAFATETLPTYGAFGSMTSSYQPTQYVLAAVVAPNADLSIGKTGPANVITGQNVVYTVTVTNNSTSTAAANVTVSDPTPANLSFVSNSGGCTTTYPCSLGTLNPGQVVTITSTYSTTAPFTGNVSNTATVSSTTLDGNSTNDSATATTSVGANANLNISKSGPTNAGTGQNITYTVVVNNAGPSPATGVVVNDPTPVGLAFQSNSGACTTTYPCSLGTLAAGQSATITSLYTIPANYSAATISNTATVSSSTADSNGADNTSTFTTNVAQAADLAISKTGPASVGVGQNAVYTITVTNLGPSPAAAVVVSDPTPAGTTFVSNSGACTSTFPCSLGVINAGASRTITTTFNVPANYSGATVTNTATVSSAATDSNAGNDSASATTNVVAAPVSDLAITKAGPATIAAGQNIVYTITVTNNGPSGTSGVTVADPTPAGLTFVSNVGSCNSAFPCNIGVLNSGQSVTISSTYTVSPGYSGASITNTATVSSPATDPVSGNNSAAATTAVTKQADVAITKTGPPAASPGQNIVYTIAVKNLGPSDASGVTVSDATPAGLTFVSNSGACTGTFPCALGTLTPGQTATITATFNVPANYSGATVSNTATVSTSTTDANSSNDSATTTASLAAQADLGITKTGPANATAGQNITYTVSVTNNGPLTANNVFVTDATPAGLTFVSNSGACSGPYPCALGSLAAGQTATITSTYNVSINAAAGPINNTANVSSSTFDGNQTNDSSTATTNASGPVADIGVAKSGPTQAPQNTFADFTLAVFNRGPSAAANVVVNDPTPSGLVFVSASAPCASGFPCTIPSLAAGQTIGINARFIATGTPGSTVTNTASVTSAVTDPSPANNTSSASMTISAAIQPPVCPTAGPALLLPASGAIAASPVTFSWNSVSGAQSYTLTVTGASTATVTTNTTTASLVLPSGAYSWSVQAALAQPCGSVTSSVSAFTVCNPLIAPVASVVGTMTTGQTFAVEWTGVDSAVSYELQESLDAAFSNPASFSVNTTNKSFKKVAQQPTTFFYRVRAKSLCDGGNGPFSTTVSVVVLPLPAPTDPRPNVSSPVGSTEPITYQLFIPGLPGGPVAFVASADKPWISVLPTAGIIPPEGLNLTISEDPTGLVNGTWTGTVIVVYLTPSAARGAIHAEDNPPAKAIPVSVSMVTPVTPSSLTTPSGGALVIASVGHLAGLSSDWRSDVRVANITAAVQRYQLAFSGSGSSALVKNTTITVDPGATTALDDIIKNWYGVATSGASASGVLTVQAVDAAGKVLPDTSLSKSTVVSSRTYNLSAVGTLGQFIPATPFAAFIGKSSGASPSSILSLQQIAQTENYRTNLGLVEAAGKAASVLLNVFDGGGAKLFSQTISLAAGEQKQLNGFLAQNNITLTNGRIEASVTGGDGRVTTYASVVDSRTNDPLLVSGVPLGGGASRFVVPGVADLNTGGASWRSDLRIFNGGLASQNATLTFYPNGNPSAAVSKSVSVAPGEVKGVDNLLQSLFGISNSGGALHVTTSTDAPLVVSARTYDETPKGTLGQFIPAVTRTEAVGTGDRPLQVLQAEESVHYRTNLGIAEVTGKPVMVEVSLILPDSKVSPKVQLPLAAFESRQFPAISSFGITNAYNVRVSVKVIDGEGRVTAYGSVIDQATLAPTYVPAQ